MDSVAVVQRKKPDSYLVGPRAAEKSQHIPQRRSSWMIKSKEGKYCKVADALCCKTPTKKNKSLKFSTLCKTDSAKVIQRSKMDIQDLEPAAEKEEDEEEAKSLDVTKVLHLLEDPLTANLKERHIFVLKKLLKRNQIGFLLRELTGITRILDICAEKVTDHPEYVPILCEALQICRLPFLKERASDELNYAQDVITLISHLGCLMRVPEAEVRLQLLETVRSFFSSVTGQMRDGLQPTSPGYRLQLVEHSNLTESLILSITMLENQPAVNVQLLKTLQLLSGSSDRNCALILNVRGAEAICLRMNIPDRSGLVLFHSSEILWNLLESGSKAEVTAQLSHLECVLSLKEAFFHKLMNSSLPPDIQLRNDLLVITTLIAENPNSQLLESLFLIELMVFITFPELESHSPLVCNLKLSFNNEDLKMKKLMLNLLVLMSRDFAALQLYREAQVMLALLMHVKMPAPKVERYSGSRYWSPVQQEELQLQALATLTTIAPLMLDDYMSYQGNTHLLLLLDWCVKQGKGSKKPQMRHCIRLLRSVTFAGEESINQDLCDQGIIRQLLGILMQLELSLDEEDVTLEMKSDIQLILSVLCENDMHRKELFGSDGVEMTLHFLRKGCGKFYSGLGHNKLVLSTVDCVWSCVVGCYATEDFFLAKDGVSLLLHLLISSPRCVHGIILATLLELCDNPNTPPHILSWRDDMGHTAPGLLLQLWRQEEESLGVPRNKHGEIIDPQRPILNQYQQDTHLSFPADAPSAAVLEISENLRAKIYSIFCKIGFLDLPGLSAKDYVILSIVRRYLDFKVCEVWEEISRELVLDDVRPISPDVENLSDISVITKDTATKTIAEQESILEQHEKESISQEVLMYTEIQSHWKYRELKAKSWDSYVSKTSNYEILKEVKAQRHKSMESSKLEDQDPQPEEHFISHVIAIERTEGHGPEGVNVTVARTSMKGAGQEVEVEVEAAAHEPEYPQDYMELKRQQMST